MRSNVYPGGNGKILKNRAKWLVLGSIFMNCFIGQREMKVRALLDADKRLNARYGSSPHVLSNILFRYKKQGLLYRHQESRRGRPFSYGMTEKGFKRLQWMLLKSPNQYFFQDNDLLLELLTQLISVLKKRKLLLNQAELQTNKELEDLIRRWRSERAR